MVACSTGGAALLTGLLLTGAFEALPRGAAGAAGTDGATHKNMTIYMRVRVFFFFFNNLPNEPEACEFPSSSTIKGLKRWND